MGNLYLHYVSLTRPNKIRRLIQTVCIDLTSFQAQIRPVRLGKLITVSSFDAPASHLDTNSTVIGAQPGFLTTNAGSGPLLVVPGTDAPQLGEDTTHYFGFTLGQGSRDVINNHIPLDPITLVRSPLDVVKSTPRKDVNFGDIVPYTITVTNTEDLPRIDLEICLLYTSPSPRDRQKSRMPSSA